MKKKILQMPVANNLGGVTNYVIQNLKFIDKEKFQFDFVTVSEKLDFEEEIKSYGGKVHYLTTRPEENQEKFIDDMSAIFDENYDVVHLHTGWWKNFLVEEIAIQKGVEKIIVHSHGTMIDISDDDKRNEAIALHNKQKQVFNKNLATDFIACSTEAGDWLFGENIPKEDIKILKNAIDVEKFSYDEEIRKKYRKELDIEENFVLGHVGRFNYSKNHEFLVDILYDLNKKIQNIKLILIGDGPLECNIKEKVKKYGLVDKVIFLGRRSDVNNIMQAIDLFLLPSRFEALGLVLIEAQCSGLKCIASTSVSKESAVTENLEFLDLNKSDWIEKIESIYTGYLRICNKENIINKGYSIIEQIKIVEKIYSWEEL